MKKLVYICALAAIAATALSCSKEKAPVKMKTVSFEMGCPQMVEEGNDSKPTGKTTLDGTSIKWMDTDVNIVAITNGTVGENWYTLTSDNTSYAFTKVFTGSIKEGEEVECLLYRRNKNATGALLSKYETKAYTFRAQHAEDQSCNGGTFNTLYNDAIAKPGDAAFKSICGYFKWKNNSAGDIKSVKVETTTPGEYLAGYYRCNYSGADPVTTAYTGSTVHNFVLSHPNNPSANKDYYIIVFPGTFNGLKITVTRTDGTTTHVFTSNAKFTVEPGKYINLNIPELPALQ